MNENDNFFLTKFKQQQQQPQFFPKSNKYEDFSKNENLIEKFLFNQ